MSLHESSFVCVCFGRVILQNLFRNFTFEIIDYFKCRSNGSSRPHLNQMLEFSSMSIHYYGNMPYFFMFNLWERNI